MFRFFILIIFFLTSAIAQTTSNVIEITQGKRTQIHLGIDFQLPAHLQKIGSVIESDLKHPDAFQFVTPPYGASSSEDKNLAIWKNTNAQFICQIVATQPKTDEVKVDVHVYHVNSQRPMMGHSFSGKLPQWRQIAHMAANKIYQSLTGQEGYFNSRITYIAMQKRGPHKSKRLAIMDYDGANHTYLTPPDAMALMPRLLPNQKRIVYVKFHAKHTRLHQFDLRSNSDVAFLKNIQGITIAPRFDASGHHMLLSIARRGSTSLFYVQSGNDLKQLTKTRKNVIDTSPCFSPDGRQIVFNSDRNGRPHIYVMSASQPFPECYSPVQISQENGQYRCPIWSPDGQWIAFVKIYQGMFYLGIMRPNGNDERLLIQDFLIDTPSWSPNGQMIIFASQSRLDQPSKVYMVDLNGQFVKQVVTPHEGISPFWSVAP